MKRILCVEDDKSWQDMLKRLFSSEYDVTVASSQGEARDNLKNNFFDLVTVNLNLSTLGDILDFEGYEFLGYMVDNYPYILKIIITGQEDISPQMDDIDLFENVNGVVEKYEVNGCFLKPKITNKPVMLQKIARIIENSRVYLLNILQNFTSNEFKELLVSCDIPIDKYISTDSQIQQALNIVSYADEYDKLGVLQKSIEKIRERSLKVIVNESVERESVRLMAKSQPPQQAQEVADGLMIKAVNEDGGFIKNTNDDRNSRLKSKGKLPMLELLTAATIKTGVAFLFSQLSKIINQEVKSHKSQITEQIQIEQDNINKLVKEVKTEGDSEKIQNYLRKFLEKEPFSKIPGVSEIYSVKNFKNWVDNQTNNFDDLLDIANIVASILKQEKNRITDAVKKDDLMKMEAALRKQIKTYTNALKYGDRTPSTDEDLFKKIQSALNFL
ncbi:DNA-binding transcriptional response regulator [Candidatus Venteria ishoeyi]|uniref:Response regulator receiver domain protein n=1 Tax=Candidatus Venteria ishoeyi TaxID=1899563 RepID=A0A1H6FF55_9GAMM|nr:response regulator [Candidatus Venteria ishoeyi]SEH08051.1 Response regulator receiver domain protein [Candidatus Venteria ishoeyi]